MHDTDREIQFVKRYCGDLGVDVALADVWGKGGEGGIELAEKVIDACERESDFKPLYELDMPIKDKIKTIAKEIYGADDVEFTKEAIKDLKNIEKLGLSHLPVCIAKTQYSLSDDPKLLGRPKGFNITVKRLNISAGAGFIVVMTGDILTMPGLPKSPAAEKMDIDEEGKITGLF
jgi:Formate--tetrahydrofolate ligase.